MMKGTEFVDFKGQSAMIHTSEDNQKLQNEKFLWQHGFSLFHVYFLQKKMYLHSLAFSITSK